MLKLTDPDTPRSEAYERKGCLRLARCSCGIGLREMELGLDRMCAPSEETCWVCFILVKAGVF